MRGLILLDWDSTIVDDDGQINDLSLEELITAKIAQGWYLGLNSDTPLHRLRRWWNILHMNGPIIAEKGAMVWWPSGQDLILSQTSSIFSVFRKEIILTLAQQEGIAIFFGDNTHFIQSVNQILCEDAILVAIDAYRICSLGIFVRQIHEGKLICDLSTAERMVELLRPLSPSHPLVSQIDLNHHHCFLSVNALDTDKSTGVRVLLEQWSQFDDVIMIGDSMTDYLNIPDIRHWAVG